MRHMEACIRSTLQRSKDICAHRRALEANIEKHLEGPPVTFVLFFDVVLLGVVFLDTLELVVHAILLQQPASTEKTCRIRCSIIGQSSRDTIFWELSRESLANTPVPNNCCICNLANDFA